MVTPPRTERDPLPTEILDSFVMRNHQYPPHSLHRTSLKVWPHPLTTSEVPERGSVVSEVVSYLLVRRIQSGPEAVAPIPSSSEALSDPRVETKMDC